MTFFLNSGEEPQPITPRGPDIAPSTYGQGVGAFFSQTARDTNASFLRQREASQEMALTAEQAARRLGFDKLRPILQEYNGNFGELGIPQNITALPETSAGFAEMFGPFSSEAILDLAAKDAVENPAIWADLEVDREKIDAGITERRKAEDAEETAIINMMPSGQTSAGLIGGMAGALADVRQMPFLMVGGGTGSLLKVLGREAFLNGLSEASTLPSQFETAKELGKPDPDPIKQIAIGALAGAVLGGAIEAPSAIRRGIEYYKARSAPPVVEGIDPATASVGMDAAEGALQDGKNPLEAVAEAMRAKAPDEPPIAPREPLIPADTPVKEAGPVVGGVDPVQTLPIPDVGKPLSVESITKMTDAAIKDLGDYTSRKPFTQWFRLKSKNLGAESNQVHPDGPFGMELRNAGITQKTNPGVFSRKGRKDFDNLPADEMEQAFPGIIDATGTERGAMYLDRQGVVDLAIRDANGDASWLRTRADAIALQKAADDAIRAIEEGTTSVQNFTSGTKADDGFFVDLNKYQFDGTDGKEAITADFDAYVSTKGYRLLPRERAEILGQLQARGGDGEYLVERALEREIDELDRASLERQANDGKDPLADGGGAQKGDPGARPEDYGQTVTDGGGTSGDGTRDTQPFNFERTRAGQQAVIPGVSPIGSKERLEALQRSPMGRGAQSEPDSQVGGLFDPGEKTRTDLFDDPRSPQAKAFDDARVNELCDALDEGDDLEISVQSDDGRDLAKLSDVLQEIDDLDAMSREIELCRTGKVSPQ